MLPLTKLLKFIVIGGLSLVKGKETLTVAYIGTHTGPPGKKDGERVSGAMPLALDIINNDSTILQNYTLNYLFADNEDNSLRSVEAVTELWAQGAIAFFGPEDFCKTEARVAAAWNLPMMSHKCDDPSVSDKELYPTFARTQSPGSLTARSLVALMEYYDWRKFTIITEQVDVYRRTADFLTQLASNMTILNQESFPGPYFPFFHKADLVRAIESTYIQTRIYVVLASKRAFIDFARVFHNMTNIDKESYVLISVQESLIYNPEENLQPLFTDLETGNLGQKNESVMAYSRVLQLVLSPPTNPDYEAWKDNVRSYLYLPPFNMRPLDDFQIRIGYKQQISIFAAYLYDAVLIYARALNEVIQSGISPRNGTAIFQRIAGRSYHSIIGNDVYIDDHGDAQSNLSVVALRPYNNTFGYGLQTVGQFFLREGNSGSVEFHERVRIYDEVPVDEPACGFYNEHCQPIPDYTTEIVVGVLGGLVLIILLVTAVLYRNWRFEQQLANLLWKINVQDIDFRHIMTSAMSVGSNFETCGHNGSQMTVGSLGSRRAQVFTKTGLYKGNIVALKWIRKKNIDINRNVRLELKQMRDLRHDHIVGFIGACVTPPYVAIVSEYCHRGSLEDVLGNEDIKIDKMLKASLDSDIMKGMAYLHSSDIESHGNLKSSNCLIDSRWVLKIADFGLTEFKSTQEHVDEGEYAKYKKHLWTAPELLRSKSRPPKGTQKGDVYSFAIILYEIEGRSGPFGDTELTPKEIVSKILSKPGEFRPDTSNLKCPSFIVDTMKLCWAEDPNERPDFKTCRRLLKPMQKGLKSNIFDNMMSIMERYASNLEGIVAERTAELVEEKKRTDSLLHRMLPPSVANQLKQGRTVEPECFESVTIYFSDICGFTALSAQSTPLQVVDLLNDLYTCFDSIIKNYDVYKVETIGDAYMVVSGLPTRNGQDHAGEIASMSLSLLTAIKKFHIRHRPDDMLKLRIGIHSGSCVAGVVGLTMPRYCLFGDTVNTASRMESNGEPLKIHVSPECRAILENLGGYNLTERGLVAMKGKGEILTYWLLDEDSRVRKERRGNSGDSGRGTGSEADTHSVMTTQDVPNGYTRTENTKTNQGDKENPNLNTLFTVKESSKMKVLKKISNSKLVDGRCSQEVPNPASLHPSSNAFGINDKKPVNTLTTANPNMPVDSDSAIIERSIMESLTDHVREHICRMNSLTSGLYRSTSSPVTQFGGMTKKNVEQDKSRTSDYPFSKKHIMTAERTGSAGFSQPIKINNLVDDTQDTDSLAQVSVNF